MPENRLVDAPHAAAKCTGLRAFQLVEGGWADPPIEAGDIVLVNPNAPPIPGKPFVARKYSKEYFLVDESQNLKVVNGEQLLGPVVAVMRKFPKPF